MSADPRADIALRECCRRQQKKTSAAGSAIQSASEIHRSECVVLSRQLGRPQYPLYVLRDFTRGRSPVSGRVIFVISAVVLRIILVVVATAGVKIEGIDDDAGNSRIYMGQ
jgi:hypothetical protein